LEAEIRDNAWICLSADPRTVLDIACHDDACSAAWHRLISLVSEVERKFIER
jgi:putative AlgH/UPF0301 family transcriptional regulator